MTMTWEITAVDAGTRVDIIARAVAPLAPGQQRVDRRFVSSSRYGCARPPSRRRASLDSQAAHASREEIIVIEGTLIAESLRVGTELENLKLTVRKISRHKQDDTAPGEPEIWTLLEFEADEADADSLAQTFARALDDQPIAWYADFRSPAETFVVFPDRRES